MLTVSLTKHHLLKTLTKFLYKSFTHGRCFLARWQRGRCDFWGVGGGGGMGAKRYGGWGAVGAGAGGWGGGGEHFITPTFFSPQHFTTAKSLH